MRRRRAALALLAVAGALAGCAAPPAMPAVSSPPATPAVSSPPAASAPAGTDWARAAIVEVALDEYAFRPERLALRQGQPVVLRLVNRGARAHDFTAPGFFAAAALRPGDRLDAAGSIEVPAGRTREIALIPLAAGSFPVDCEKPLHAMFGMTGEVVVAPPAPV